MTWKEKVVDALKNLGGEAHLDEIYNYIATTYNEDLPDSWKAVIRRTLEQSSSDSQAYDGKTDLFYSVYGLGKGSWGLRE